MTMVASSRTHFLHPHANDCKMTSHSMPIIEAQRYHLIHPPHPRGSGHQSETNMLTTSAHSVRTMLPYDSRPAGEIIVVCSSLGASGDTNHTYTDTRKLFRLRDSNELPNEPGASNVTQFRDEQAILSSPLRPFLIDS